MTTAIRFTIVTLAALLLAGCATAGGLTRNAADSTRLVYDAPASTVFAAAVAAVGDLEVTSQDQGLGEIRLQRESYMSGILVCYGHVMAVFLSPDGETRTRVEIVEQTYSRAQLAGCHAQTPAYVERLNAKLNAAP